MTDTFRKMYGDELADQVEQLKKKPNGDEVLKPKPKRDEPKRQPEHEESWWDR